MNTKHLVIIAAAAGTLLTAMTSAAGAAVPAVATAPVQAQAAEQSTPDIRSLYHQYRNKSTGLCLDTRKDPGNAAVRMVACHPDGHKDIRHQLWISQTDGTFRSRINDDTCLAGYGDGIVMRSCGASETQWVWISGKIKSPNGKCASATSGSIYLRKDNCNSSSAQGWVSL